MGQSWQRPKQEPRLGRVEVWVERARNLAPELHETINTWTDEARVRVVLMLMGEERCLWRAESESKVGRCACLGADDDGWGLERGSGPMTTSIHHAPIAQVGIRHGLKQNAPVFREKVK